MPWQEAIQTNLYLSPIFRHSYASVTLAHLCQPKVVLPQLKSKKGSGVAVGAKKIVGVGDGTLVGVGEGTLVGVGEGTLAGVGDAPLLQGEPNGQY